MSPTGSAVGWSAASGKVSPAGGVGAGSGVVGVGGAACPSCGGRSRVPCWGSACWSSAPSNASRSASENPSSGTSNAGAFVSANTSAPGSTSGVSLMTGLPVSGSMSVSGIGMVFPARASRAPEIVAAATSIGAVTPSPAISASTSRVPNAAATDSASPVASIARASPRPPRAP